MDIMSEIINVLCLMSYVLSDEGVTFVQSEKLKSDLLSKTNNGIRPVKDI